MRRTLAAHLLTTIALSPAVDAQETERPRIGVVFSGGGARGIAHIGVLRVLEELRVPIDYIAGNSMGALVGGVYAYGYSPQEMDDLIRSLDWSTLLSDGLPRDDRAWRRKQEERRFLVKFRIGIRDFEIKLPKGLTQGHAIGNLLRFLLPDSYRVDDFDELPIPFRAVATVIATGEEVVLESGSLPAALTASMAIPGVFAPVTIDGRELVDGLVVDNIPIGVVRGMGADVVIAIDIGSPLLEADQIGSLLDVTSQMVGILTQKNVDEQLQGLTDADLLIRPDLGDIGAMSFERAADAIALGEQAARALADQLRRFSVSEAEYADYLRRQRLPAYEPPTVDGVHIVNNSRLSDAVIEARVRTKAGEPFDPETLRRDIDALYGLEEFERVTFALEETEDGETHLDIVVDEKSWGPNYLRFGLQFVDDFNGDAFYELLINHTMQSLNGLGGELRTEVGLGRVLAARTEFFQPVEPTQTLFVSASANVGRLPLRVFDGDGDLTTEFTTRTLGGGGDIGILLGNAGEVRFGYRRAYGSNSVRSTTVGAQGGDFDEGYLRALLRIDTYDRIAFPTAGSAALIEWLGSWKDLGSDSDWQRLEVGGAQFASLGRTSFGVAATFGTTLEGTVPVQRQFFEGGFLLLSGLRYRQLAGQHSALFQLFGYHRVAGSPTDVVGMPLYVGASVETGNTWQRRDDVFDDMIVAGSVFVGTDTPLGPIYVGYGLTDDGRDSLYMYLGQLLR